MQEHFDKVCKNEIEEERRAKLTELENKKFERKLKKFVRKEVRKEVKRIIKAGEAKS